jgi:hypothetical protein
VLGTIEGVTRHRGAEVKTEAVSPEPDTNDSQPRSLSSAHRPEPVALKRSQRDEQQDPVAAARDVDDGAAAARRYGAAIEVG